MIEERQTIFVERLSSLISAKAASYNAFAKSIGASAPSVYRYFSRERSPSSDTLIAIAEKYGCSIDWLFGFQDDFFPSVDPKYQRMINLYSLANETDQKIIDTILDKYSDALDNGQALIKESSKKAGRKKLEK